MEEVEEEVERYFRRRGRREHMAGNLKPDQPDHGFIVRHVMDT